MTSPTTYASATQIINSTTLNHSSDYIGKIFENTYAIGGPVDNNTNTTPITTDVCVYSLRQYLVNQAP